MSPATADHTASQSPDTLTFVFTDIEGSTRKWEAFPHAMRIALERHDHLLRKAVEQNGGRVFKTLGDAFCAVFPEPARAVTAALQAQRALAQETWDGLGALRIRIGVHAGPVQERHGDYFGPAVNRVARIQAIGHGGQTLLSEAAADLVREYLPPGAWLKDLGSHRLKDLGRAEHVFQCCTAGVPDEFPPLRSLQAFANNLPLQMSSFIGRASELTTLKELLAHHRLVTLTGPGGTGKTRLALQVAAERLEAYGDGVWFVDLAPLTDAALVPQALAGALGTREEADRPLRETLIDDLRAKSALLVLDNCEHVIAACAALAKALLQACPAVRLLATSREALAVAGEQTWRVPPLALPDPDRWPAAEKDIGGALLEYDAVRLFVERARAQRRTFTLRRENAAAVTQICLRLDGIPLALELAAARVRALSVEQIQARLDDRFRLLTGGARTDLPRHQTLRALIDWSHDLLTGPEQALLARLSVFAGDWCLDAAEAVCSGEDIEAWSVLDLLTSLVDKSLVVYEEEDNIEGASGRYRLLESVRQYAAERLQGAREGAARIRHRAFYLALAEQAEPHLRGPDQAAWLSRLEADHDNFRAVLRACAADGGECPAALRLCAALWWFWYTRGHFAEGRQWLGQVLEYAGDDAPARARALRGAGVLAWNQGDYAAARALYEESLRLCRQTEDAQGTAQALSSLGNVACSQSDYAAARALYQESLETSREIGDDAGSASTLYNLGYAAFAQGDAESARTFYRESLGLFRPLRNLQGIANALGALGSVALAQNDCASARSLYEESLDIRRRIGDQSGIAISLAELGDVALAQSDCASARAFYEESLAIKRRLDDRQGIAIVLTMLGDVALAEGDGEQARILNQESLEIARRLGDQSCIALTLCNLGNVSLAQGDGATARDCYRESLEIARRIEKLVFIAYALEGLAAVTADSQAARWQGATGALRTRIRAPLNASEQDREQARIEQVRAVLGQDAYAAAFAAGEALTWEQAVAEAL